jgi:hypothetical protein
VLVVLMPSTVLLSPASQRESLSPPPLVQLRIPSRAVRPALSSLAIGILPGVIFLGGLSFRFRSGLLDSVANPLIVFCPLFPCRYISGVRTLGVRVDPFVLVSSVPEVRFGRLVVLIIRTSGSAMKADASEMALADSGQFSSYMSLSSINLSGSSGSHSSAISFWRLLEAISSSSRAALTGACSCVSVHSCSLLNKRASSPHFLDRQSLDASRRSFLPVTRPSHLNGETMKASGKSFLILMTSSSALFLCEFLRSSIAGWSFGNTPQEG